MIDFEKCRKQMLNLMQDWDVDVTAMDDDDLSTLLFELTSIVSAGEDVVDKGGCYSHLHSAQVLEPIVRIEIERRAAGEELPGDGPYDPVQTAREMKEVRARVRAQSNGSGPN